MGAAPGYPGEGDEVVDPFGESFGGRTGRERVVGRGSRTAQSVVFHVPDCDCA